tara:strand:- start:3416 stop:4423 length:1008 start_codon:yes stop_codon:yes gene_type:complete
MTNISSQRTIAILGEKPVIILGCNFGFILTVLKKLFHKVRKVLGFQPKSHQGHKSIQGHPVVTREIIDGLKDRQRRYVVDPLRIAQHSDFLILGREQWIEVLATLGRGKEIRNIVIGPNVPFLKGKHKEEIKELSAVILCPSQWVVDNFVRQAPMLKKYINVWSCGISIENWSPADANAERRKVILYRKYSPRNSCLEKMLEAHAEQHNYEIVNVVYGSYTIDEWKNYLNSSFCIIYQTSLAESQGLALLEAWAMNVPSLVYRVNRFKNNDREIEGAVTAPYMTKRCGKYWDELTDLGQQLDEIVLGKTNYSPREAVVKAHTREAATEKLLAFFK